MDTYSAEMAEVFEALFDPGTGELRKDVKELLGDVPFRNILVIDRVEILPAYRGMGLGLATIWDIIQRHSAGCGIVALKAFPFQFSSGSRSGRLSFLEESDWNKEMGYDTHSYTIVRPRSPEGRYLQVVLAERVFYAQSGNMLEL